MYLERATGSSSTDHADLQGGMVEAMAYMTRKNTETTRPC